MAWVKTVTPGFVNTETGVYADVVVNDSLYRIRFAGKQLAVGGWATEQEALDALELMVQGYTLT